MTDGCPLPYLSIADSASQLLLVTEACDVFVWEIDRGQSLVTAVNETSHACGTWSPVDKCGQSATLAAAANHELAIHAVFTLDTSVRFLCKALLFVKSNWYPVGVVTGTLWGSTEMQDREVMEQRAGVENAGLENGRPYSSIVLEQSTC